MHQHLRPHSFFSKILQNRTAAACIFIMTILVIISFLSYLIIPDKSKNGNRQILELSLLYPGSSQRVLILPGDQENTRMYHSIFFNGRHDLRQYVPIDSIQYSNEDVIAHFGESEKTFLNITKDDVTIRSLFFVMGTDKYGRDVLSRLILGLRASLLIGFFAVLVSVSLGILIGSLGGYHGGTFDKVTMLLINASWSIPTILMAFAIIIALGKGFLVIVLAVGLTMWVDVARLMRGQVMEIKNRLYVKAARVLGFKNFRIILFHVLPNIIGPILVMAAANFATAILVEAGLSYLGLGIQPPTPSLGNMLKEGYAFATGGFVYLAIFPIATIMTLVLCFNLLGTALRDVFDFQSNTT